MNVTADALTQRLNRLERELRWWKRVNLVVLTTAAIVVTTASSVAVPGDFRELRASRFVLVDASDTVRAELGLAVSGAPLFRLANKSGKNGVVVTLDQFDEPEVYLFGSDGKVRTTFNTLGSLRGSGVPRFPAITLHDSNEEIVVELTGGSLSGRPGLSVYGSHDPGSRSPRSVAKLGVDRQNHLPSLEFIDNLDPKNLGVTRMVLGYAALETASGVAELRPPSSLVLFDKRGRVIWKVP